MNISHLVNLRNRRVRIADLFGNRLRDRPMMRHPEISRANPIVHPFSTRGMFGWLREVDRRALQCTWCSVCGSTQAVQDPHTSGRGSMRAVSNVPHAARLVQTRPVKAIIELSLLALSSYREYQRSNISLSWLPISPPARCSFVFA